MSIKKLKRLAKFKKSAKVQVPFEPRELKPVAKEDLFRPFSDAERKEIESKSTLKESLVLKPAKAKPKKKKQPALTVGLEELFKTKVKAVYSQDVISKRWGVKERTLAKKLVNTYGRELVVEVFNTFIDSWPQMVSQSRGRLYGLPTINFLWSCQDRFFGQAQIGEQPVATPGRTDEYREVQDDDDSW